MKGIIGIPRGMYYHDYGVLWKNFFNYLGVETITSKKTNKTILDQGIKHCVDEACLPVKIYHGHVHDLIGKVDYLFIPKIISVAKKEYGCPKHLGLPEMIKNSINNLPLIISPEINLYKDRNKLFKEVIKVARVFNIRKKEIRRAYEKAFNDYLLKKNVEKLRDKYILGNKILVLGHPYIIKDQFLNMSIKSKLKEYNFEIITPDNMEEMDQRMMCRDLDKRMFWTQGQKILGTSMKLIEDKTIGGIIYISSFGCGLDSIFLDYIESYTKGKEIPYTVITIDEQTGEAGVNTRLEAFMDMVLWRYKDENYISSLW